MHSRNHRKLLLLSAAVIVWMSVGTAAFGAVGDATRAAAPICLGDAIARITPKEQRPASSLLSLGNTESEEYSPLLRGQLRHAEGNAIPLQDTIGLDATTMSLEVRQPIYRSGQGRAQAQVYDSRARATLAQKLDEQMQRNHLITNAYIDVLSLDAQRQLVNNFSTTKLRLDSEYKKARKTLQTLAGIDKDTPLQDIASPVLPATLQSALALAEQKHPSVIQAHYECAAAEADTRALNWEDAPNIDLRGGLDRTTDTYANDRSEDSGIIGLRATIPLRSGDERKSLLVQAHEDAQSGRMKLDTARLETRQNVIAAWDALTQARAEERFQTRKAELAESAAQGHVPTGSKLLGMGNNDAFAKLAYQSRLAAVAAHYNTLKAEFGLLAATGQLNQALASVQPVPQYSAANAINLQNNEGSADLSIK